jgi:hypothetical protein
MISGYRHSQAGILIVVWVGLAAGGIILAVYMGGMPPVGLVVAGVLLVCLRIFGSLTVEVDRGAVRLCFGFGLFRREFRVGEIRSVRAVRNQWYMGWGIHRLPRGWLYNVSGLDAVELELAGGAVHRIGTDEPQALAAAIRGAAGLPAN